MYVASRSSKKDDTMSVIFVKLYNWGKTYLK